MVCTFFGHRDTYMDLSQELTAVLQDLIEHKQVDRFYVGNHGFFDQQAIETLRSLQNHYTHISYAVVLAYLPTSDRTDPTVYPEGLESVPRRFTIDRRNRWMIEQADYVVTHVRHSFGGATKFMELAKRKGKIVINIPLSDA